MPLKRYRDWPIQFKIMIIPVIALLVALVAVECFLIPALQKNVLESRKKATQQVVEVASGFIAGYDQEVKAGRMPLAVAQAASIDAIRSLRYAPHGYIWINDLTPKMIVHPTKPELDGKDLADSRDPNDKRLFVEFVRVCRERGAGFVEYLWPKPDEEKPLPKVSYVKLFTPWGWIIGSGVYVDDVARDAALVQWWIRGIALALTLFLVGLSFSMAGMITRPLRAVIDQLKEMTCGNADLTQRIAVPQHDESGELAAVFNGFLENLQGVIANVRKCSTDVAAAAFNIRKRADDITRGAENVASEATTVATSGEEMAATAEVIAQNCRMAVDASQTTRGYARDGSAIVENVISVMGQIADQVQASAHTVGVLGDRSEHIGAIIGTIEEIADQTNLLALNAAIEAARAGDQGRGFAVVADEVRSLAERTAKATQEITRMIKTIQQETQGAVATMKEGVTRVNEGSGETAKSGEALEQILAQVGHVAEQINQIAVAAVEQTATTSEISSNIDRITGLAKEECTQAEDLVRAATELNRLAEEMISSVNHFQTIIKWNDWMSVRVAKFDTAHQKLIAMIGQLNDSFTRGEGNRSITEILSSLATYCVGHFADEEGLMKQYNYPGYAEHKRIHDAFVAKVKETIQAFENGEISPASIMNLLSDWLMGHILKVDKEYAEFFSRKGIR